MARAYPLSDMSDPEHEPQPGEWQALRGELVALLDQVEGRYARVEEPEPVLTGLAQRVRHLRDQVERPEPAVRRREALRTVKRAVDRFSVNDRDDASAAPVDDMLTSAIAEIRGRQMSGSAAALGHRAVDMPEFRELSGLVGGLSGRLERLETELKSQRASNGSVREVANQVEQLTHVVELLAGAVGETGQVKRLESQIAALGAMIEDAPRVDLSAINNRLDDVSVTVGKLAELQAQQMEREVVREERKSAKPERDSVAELAPTMHAIESSVRNVYDRIDAIEKNVALSSGEFEQLTAEMAAFTQAMKDGAGQPGKLVAKVDALAARIGDFEAANGDVLGLKQDISGLRDAVLAGMEPRFSAIESQLDALASRPVPQAADNSQVEKQLKLLMARMDETGAQLNGLAKLYSAQDDSTDMEALATMVAERTSEAVTRKAPAPVAMFGADSLKSIEASLTGLIKSAGKTPDYESLADMVAEKTSAAMVKAAPVALAAQPAISEESMSALEKRMTAVFNTAGRDTAERLTRLEAVLTARTEPAAAPAAPVAAKAEARPEPKSAVDQRLDTMLAALAQPEPDARNDRMPVNPADDAPLRDPGFAPAAPARSALEAKAAATPRPETIAERPLFDPSSVERPPRPQSSLAKAESDPFAPVASAASPQVEAPLSQNSTSTFVAAARRAQRARQETTAPAATSNSLIGRALARVMPAAAPASTDAMAEPPLLPKAEKPAKPIKEKKPRKEKAEAPVLPPMFDEPGLAAAPQQSFITRHRRPILLSLTLVVVSMLALNLVLQRMASAPAESASVVDTPAIETPEAEVAPEGVSDLSKPTRVIDMIDTASINPGAPMSFREPALATPMPPSLVAATAPAARTAPAVIAPLPSEPMVTGSIPDAATAAPETFPLPPEAVGPIELRQAAADGDARAQFEIGAIFTEGRALPADPIEAAKWYERSAAQGFTPSQYRLGNLYEVGQGVEKDLEVARLWYQRSAEAGNRMAMHNLAALYASGQLGEQQFDAASEWFQRAAARGMTDSQFNLGMLYARGLGVEQDFEQSYKWFALAARNGDADAAKARDDMAKSLNAEAVSRINAEVSAFKAEPIDLAANFAPLGTWSPSFAPGDAITTRDVVIKVQQALAKLGYDIGVPDGVAGPKTAAAVRAFETGTGMSESGTINPRLLAVLGSQPV